MTYQPVDLRGYTISPSLEFVFETSTPNEIVGNIAK